jgi:RNA polymerase sigma-70 factor, ECF subfamily
VSSESLQADARADDDRRLIRAIAGGSAEALADLYDRHAAVVFGLATRITGRLEDAEEVVQDVFAQVWRQAARYEVGRASVAGWLVMLARTRAIDRIRARAARPDQAAAVEPDAAPALTSSTPSPEQVTLSDEDARRVRGALMSLPDTQRALLDLAYYDGLTHAEIAARTGIPLGTVKTRLRTAMATLRTVLGAGGA